MDRSWVRGTDIGSGQVLLWSPMQSSSNAIADAIARERQARLIRDPYYSAYAYGPDRRLRCFADATNTLPYATYEQIKASLEQAKSNGKDLIVKDRASAIPAARYHALPNGYRHCFLVRNPIDVCLSLARWLLANPRRAWAISQHRLDDIIGFRRLHTLYQHVASLTGESPLVLDAVDFRQDVDPSYSALADPAGRPSSPTSRRATITAGASSVDVADLPDRYKRSIDAMMPYYQDLVGMKAVRSQTPERQVPVAIAGA